MENVGDVQMKVMMDAGAGSGILSPSAAQVRTGDDLRMLSRGGEFPFISEAIKTKPAMPEISQDCPAHDSLPANVKLCKHAVTYQGLLVTPQSIDAAAKGMGHPKRSQHG